MSVCASSNIYSFIKLILTIQTRLLGTLMASGKDDRAFSLLIIIRFWPPRAELFVIILQLSVIFVCHISVILPIFLPFYNEFA